MNIKRRISTKSLRKKTSFKSLSNNNTILEKKVKFIDDLIEEAKNNNICFTIEFFIYIIDKFLSSQNNHIYIDTNNEFEAFL